MPDYPIYREIDDYIVALVIRLQRIRRNKNNALHSYFNNRRITRRSVANWMAECWQNEHLSSFMCRDECQKGCRHGNPPMKISLLSIGSENPNAEVKEAEIRFDRDGGYRIVPG